MRFLTDENVSPTVVEALRNAGHDVLDVKEKEWHGHPDQVLVAEAQRELRIIITHDKDFLHQQKVSIILLRFYNQNASVVTPYLLTFLNSRFAKKLTTPRVVILSEYRVEFHHPS